MRASLRAKLAIGFALAVLVPSIVGAGIVLNLIQARVDEQAQAKITTDLNLARAIFDGERLRLTELSMELRRASRVLLYKRRLAELRTILDDARLHGRLDMALVTDRKGRVLYRAGSPRRGDRIAGDPFVQHALRGHTAEGVQIASPQLLRANGLSAPARVKIVSSAHAYPFGASAESRGMLLKTATPMVDTDGRLTGTLVVAVLLNNDNWIVDRARKHAHGDSAAIYLGPVCIATSDMTDHGTRAVGTLAWQPLGRGVLDSGRRFFGETRDVRGAWVVGGEPIRDRSGKVVGILQTAMSQQRFLALKDRATLTLGAVILMTLASGLVVSMLSVRRLTQPLEDLVGIARRIGAGDLSARADARRSDEVGALCDEFNRMAERLQRQIGELNRSSELKSEFVAIASHELRTPVAVIKSYLDLIVSGAYQGRPDELEERLARVGRQVKHLSSLLDDLLDLSRLERRELAVKRERVSIRTLVEDVVIDASRTLELERRSLTSTVSSDPMLVQGDGVQLHRLLMNLVGNSAKFTSPGDRITVLAHPVDGDVEIVVEDSGVGISAEDMSLVFAPFFQVEDSMRRAHAGLGLGLALSKEIVEAHGGTITLTSAPGKGTRVTVRLPAKMTSRAVTLI